MLRYCPSGHGAYEDWVERCPECGRRLGDAPPAQPVGPSGDDPIVPLTTAPNEPLAHLLAQVLLDEGIRTVVKPRGPGYGAWASVATFEHEVFVLASERARAQEIVAELRSDDARDDDEGEPGPSDSSGREPG